MNDFKTTMSTDNKIVLLLDVEHFFSRKNKIIFFKTKSLQKTLQKK